MTAVDLLLVRPLGFSTSDRMLKRAGLDYWYRINVSFTDDLFSYLEACSTRFFFFSSRASRPYSDIQYTESDTLIFGSETAGLPPLFWDKWSHLFYTIPMISRKNPPYPLPDVQESIRPSLENDLPQEWKSRKREQDSGCLNLSNAVSIVIYEALRQKEFQSLRL